MSRAANFYVFNHDYWALATTLDPDFDSSDDTLLLRPCWHELHPDAWAGCTPEPNGPCRPTRGELEAGEQALRQRKSAWAI
jgi:hypothetical protein